MPKINPKDITIDPSGKVVIENKALAKSLKAALEGKKGVKLKPGGSSALLDVNFGC